MNKFSIIIPVRNGGDYLKQAIKSILAQTFTCFDLIIVESGSTDGSLEYIRSINDERLVLHTTNESLGIEANWARILKVEKSEYLTILGQDDILHPDYLETINNLIGQYPEASLYQTHFNYINAVSSIIRPCQQMQEVASLPVFLKAILENKIDFMASGFMMRSKDYDAVGGIPNYPNLLFADVELFLNLVKNGYLAVSPQTCFSFRIHQSTTTISADLKFQQAFGQFVGYLEKLGKEEAAYRQIISKHGESFLMFYCKGLVHRLIRKPKRLRPGVRVALFIKQCKAYANRLMLEKPFEPEKIFSIRLAKWIDRFALTRGVFLLFKKVYSKSVL